MGYKNSVAIGSETIYTETSNLGYRQMIVFTGEMDPRWKASNVRLVFGDKMITKKLLLQSRMTKAFFNCESWHLINEVYLSQPTIKPLVVT